MSGGDSDSIYNCGLESKGLEMSRGGLSRKWQDADLCATGLSFGKPEEVRTAALTQQHQHCLKLSGPRLNSDSLITFLLRARNSPDPKHEKKFIITKKLLSVDLLSN